MFDKVEMGNRMFTARIRKNMKQWEMGKILGMHQSTYSDIETGKKSIDTEQLFVIADALNVPVPWLLGISDDDGLTNEERLQIEDFKRFIISKRVK